MKMDVVFEGFGVQTTKNHVRFHVGIEFQGGASKRNEIPNLPKPSLPKDGSKRTWFLVLWGAKTSENQVRLEPHVHILETAVNKRPLGRSWQPRSRE